MVPNTVYETNKRGAQSGGHTSVYGESELKRLCALGHLDILDSEPEEQFDHVAQQACWSLDAPFALISFVDYSRVWFKSKVNIEASEQSRDESFCNETIRRGDVYTVYDVLQDDVLRTNPLAQGAPYVRSYAGVCLAVRPRLAIGTLCVFYDRPTFFTKAMHETLRTYGASVLTLIEERVALAGRREYLDRLGQ